MTALLLIDIQIGLDEFDFYGGQRNNPQAEANCRKLLDYFRQQNLPRYFVQHDSTNPQSPLYPGKKGHAIKPVVQPLADEPIFRKNVNSAFIGTKLEQRLKSDGIEHLVIVGLTTEHCVSTSTRMAANLGFKVTLISDATAAFKKTGSNGKTYDAEIVHSIALANLKNEFAEIMDTESVLQQLPSS